MMARVRGVIRPSIRSRSRFQVSRSEFYRNRNGVGVDHRQRGRDIGACTEQDFIPRRQIQRRDRQVQRRRPAGDGDAVAAVAERGEPFLKFGDRGAEGTRDFAATKCGNDAGNLILAEIRLENGYHDFISTKTLS